MISITIQSTNKQEFGYRKITSQHAKYHFISAYSANTDRLIVKHGYGPARSSSTPPQGQLYTK